MGMAFRTANQIHWGAVPTSVPAIWVVGMPPNMLSVQCGTSPSRRWTSRASLDMPTLFWMSPWLRSLPSNTIGENNMDAAKNITTTEMRWGSADGNRERKSKDVMPCKLGRDRLRQRGGRAGIQSFTSSKSTYSPSRESSARRCAPEELVRVEEASVNRPRRPPNTRSSQRQMNHTATMYNSVRNSPANMLRRSTYLLKYKLRSLYTLRKNGSRRLGMNRMASPVDFISGPSSFFTLGNLE